MRANSTISILSAAGSEKIAVPITAASHRRWKLMEEDSITLYFNLAESIDFAVGDYIVDEVFGRFVISEEPVPADYDPVSGAYKYTLRFDADWICWKNYILMLTYNGVRKETSWVLTDTLENHLAVVVQNLAAVGYTGYSVNVDANTVPDKGKAVCVTYSGTTVLDALKNLADAYECEFWLDGKVIRFGKCLTGTMTDLSMTNENGRTINVENMVPMRNDSEYGNRFFAYGSTKNLPETYRKHLSFKADTTSRIGGYTAFKDSLRPMFPDFLKRSIVQTSNPTQHSYEDDWLDYSYTEEEDHDEMTTWKNIRVEKTTNPIPVVQGWPFTITPYTSQYGSFQYTVYIYDQDGNLLISTTNTLVPMTYTIPEGVDKITVRYSFESETHLSRPAPLPPTVEWLDNTEYAYFATVSYTGGTFLVRLMDGWFRAVNSRTGTVTYKNPPSGFTTNTEYTLLTTGDDPIKAASIPYSYYTDDDDTTDAVRVLGERRLMLPRPPYTDSDLVAIQSHIENGYVQRASLSRDQIVERVVFFDEIYPRCALRITRVDVGEYANDTTYSDGSVKIANLPSYTLQAQLVTRSGDVAFPFDPETMMVVGKLTATFLTPDEAKVYSGRTTENACSLMGMTFDVACNRSNGVTTYQLVWNSDYGEKLPNEILMPKVGDCFILAGWNPAAMSTLGLIDAAEKELALTADRYAELLEEAQFNFDCTMMSDWVKAWYDGKTPVSGELPFRRLILPGQSVRVFHGALSAPKETRVIGFEYKLDIPYDSPVLTVGESDAYSRLREIEKSLHASSQSSTATSNTTSVNITGGSAAQGGGQTLHLTPGTMTGMSPVDYNGSEEKTFRVPSVIDHLVDSDKVPRIATNIAGDKVLVDKEGNEVSGKQFFEEKTDPNDSTKKYIWLKDEYTGLGVPGWLASGGVGNGAGGGGGIISSVYGENRLGTIYSAGGSESLTETFSAFAIDKVWQSVLALQQSTPNVSLTNGQEYSSISINGASAQFYTKSQVDAMIGGFNPSLYLPKAGGTMTGHLIMNGGDIIPGEGATVNLGYGNRRFSGLNVNTLSTSYFSFRNANWEEIAHFSGGADYLAVYLATSTEYYFFGNTSFQGRGAAKNLGESYVRWGKLWCSDGDLSGALNVGSTATIASHINVGGVVNVNSVSSIDQSHNDMALFNYGARTTKSFNAYGLSANLRAIDANGTQVNTLAVVSGSILCGSSIRPDYNLASANLGSASNDGGRWSNIYAVNANLTGDITLDTTSHIDIGPVRIEYHSSTDSLHITTNDATNHPDIGFWVDGFNSAGGYGSNGGGGGGLITGVYGVSDLGSVYSTGGTEDFTKTFSAFAIDKVWQTLVSLQNSTPDVSLTNGSSYSTLWVNNTSVTFYTKSQVDSLLVGIHSFDYVTASSLPTAGVDTMYKIYLVPSADPQTLNVKDEYITVRSGSSGSYSYSWEQIGSTAVDLSGYVTTTALGNWTGSTNITTLGTITTGTWSGTAIGVTKGGTGLTAISKGAILYASAANTISALSANGTSTKKFLSQTSSNAPSWGTISLTDISGTSDLQAIEDLSGTSGLLKKTAANTWTLDTTSYLSSHQTIYKLTLNAGSFTAGEYTPNSAAKTIKVPTTLDHISDGTNRKLSDYVTLHTTQEIDGEKTFITNPLKIGKDQSPNRIEVYENSYIDIGDARLEYDSTSHALRVTKKSGTSNTIGLYADGFVAAGGTAASASRNIVFTDDAQTITGIKTVIAPFILDGSNLEPPAGSSVIPDILTVTGTSKFTGNVTITGNIYATTFGGGVSISSDEINYSSRLYIQYNSNDLCLTKNGKTIIGSYPGSSAIGSNKFYVAGSSIGSAWNTSSDERLKDNVRSVRRDEAVDTIMRLNPVTWTWNEKSELEGKRSAGLIAQQVESVIPFMVTGEELKGLNYTMLHAFEISAIQSHEERIRSLEKENKSLREQIERLRA